MISFIYPGLTLRRFFWGVDLSVAVVCAMLVAHVVMRFFFPPPSTIDQGPAAPSELPRIMARQVPKGDIDRIRDNPVFGDDSTMSTPIKEPPPPVVPDRNAETESTLKLEVTGIVWDNDPMLCSCVILDAKLRKTGSYKIGQEISTGVFVTAIYPNRVMLDEHGKTTYLNFDSDEDDKGGTPQKAPTSTRPTSAPLPKVVELSRTDIRERVGDLLALRDSVKVEPYKEGGRVVGLQVSNLGDNPMAADIGIEDGDVVQSINSVRINDMDTAVEQLTKLANAPMIRVGIMRNGQRTFLTYRIR